MTEDTENGEKQERVVVDQPERQNLLGLLMKNILAENLADETKYARVRGVTADILVQAGEMTITLRLGEGRVTIMAGPTDHPKAKVRGDMAALLGVASGGGILGPFFRGEIRAGGNLMLLLKILPLIKRPDASPDQRVETREEK